MDLHPHVGIKKQKHSGFEQVSRCEPSIYQLIISHLATALLMPVVKKQKHVDFFGIMK